MGLSWLVSITPKEDCPRYYLRPEPKHTDSINVIEPKEISRLLNKQAKSMGVTGNTECVFWINK